MKEKIRIVFFVRQYISRAKMSKSRKSSFRTLALKIEQLEKYLGKELFTNSFDTEMIHEFEYYLKSRNERYRTNTVMSYLRRLFYILRKAETAQYRVHFAYSTYRLKGFESFEVALTVEEIQSIYNCKKLSSAQKVVRDLFVFSCYTGLRYSDLKRVESINIQNEILNIKTQKTGATVHLPLHPYLKGILERNKGELPTLSSQQNYNKVLKTLCRKAKIQQKILIERHEGLKFIRKNVPKWKLISSHTGRRSFATNAYLAEIPTARIMLLTGHKTEESFFKYIRIQKKENAQILSEHPFFNQ